MAKRLQCPQGHPLVFMACQDGPYKAGWTCSSCSRVHPGSEKRHVCKRCTFDVCVECEPVFEEKRVPTFLNPVTKAREPLLREDLAGQWVAPQFVEDMIALRFTYISDAHKKMIQDCVHWTIPALKWSCLLYTSPSPRDRG